MCFENNQGLKICKQLKNSLQLKHDIRPDFRVAFPSKNILFIYMAFKYVMKLIGLCLLK